MNLPAYAGGDWHIIGIVSLAPACRSASLGRIMDAGQSSGIISINGATNDLSALPNRRRLHRNMSGKRTEKVLQIEAVEVDRLLLDPENRRLEGTVKTTGQAELIKAMWKAMAVNEVALSIAANGVFEEVGQARLTWAGRTVNGRNKFPPARAIQDGHCRQSP